MATLFRAISAAILLLSIGPWPAYANLTEKGLFNSASEAFSGAFYARAEAEFGSYVQQFTNSTRLGEAILMQARSRIELGNYNGAIELLTSKLPEAEKLLDQYLFWLGNAHYRNGAYERAADQFKAVMTQNPNSSRLLEAAIGEALARSRLGDWPRVVQLLAPTNSVFQAATAGRQAAEAAVPGFLLLAEAHFMLKDFAATEAALQPLMKLPLQPKPSWQRAYLLARVAQARGQVQEALSSTTNLWALANATGEGAVLAEAVGFEAGLLESLSRYDEAIETYEKNLAAGLPADRQQHALERIAFLALEHNKISKATQVFEKFCARPRETPWKDMALLTLAELRLRQYLTGSNGSGETNLHQAITALTNLVQDFPKSSFIGKAHLSLGWCRWQENKFPEARSSFQSAADNLAVSVEKATALFKLADCQFRLGDYPGAMTNYEAVISGFRGVSEVINSLVEPALYQRVRAAVASGDLAAATNSLGRILESYPTGYHTERAVLVTGQTKAAQGDPARAREILLEFAKAAPGSPFMPQLEMAIANTHEREEHWEEVIFVYDAWLNQYTDSALRPEAEYRRAWANFQAGQETNAFTQFTSFLSEFPQHDKAPLARWWIADYNFRKGKYPDAEKNYQLLFQNTNWNQSTLAYEARMMAGRTAVLRYAWRDATNYFSNLASDSKCPPPLRARAMFAYGDVLMMQDSTNKVADYDQAISVFTAVAERFPTNEIAVLALGQKAACLLQWAESSGNYDPALKEFQKLTNAPLANLTVRSIARVGMGAVLEKQAQQKGGAERAALLTAAMNSYLDVFFFESDLREGEKPDPFWIKRAGWEAGRLAEQMQNWTQAIRVYDRLRELIPSLRATLERKIERASENLGRVRT